jgi:hypothetical protein
VDAPSRLGITTSELTSHVFGLVLTSVPQRRLRHRWWLILPAAEGVPKRGTTVTVMKVGCRICLYHRSVNRSVTVREFSI